MEQDLKTPLIPEIGLELDPTHIMKSKIATDFIRSIAHVVGLGNQGGIMIRSTSDGRLYVATAGTTIEWYDVETDNAPDAWNVAQTYEYADAILKTDIIIETFDAEIQWRNHAGVWGAVKRAPVGAMSFDFTHYGIRLRNRVALSVAVFEVTVYR